MTIFKRLEKWKNELSICIRCGYCYELCPLYKGTNWEADTPRGKLLLLYGILTDEIELTPEIAENIKYSIKFVVSIRNIEEKEPKINARRKVVHDTKINLNSRPGFESIFPKLNLYTKEATPHVIRASNVKIYPINSDIILKLLIMLF